MTQTFQVSMDYSLVHQSNILDYVQMTTHNSIMKRSPSILTWNVWVIFLIGGEELNYVQVAIQCCSVKRSAIPFVFEISLFLIVCV